MNKLLISAGAAFSAIGLMTSAPAQAGTLTFGYEVDSRLQITFSPLLAGNAFSGVTVPSSLWVMADDVTGSFTVLDDPAQFTDGSVVLDDGLLNDALLGSSYGSMLDALLGDSGLTSSGVVASVDNLFTIDNFQGGGELVSKDFTLPLSPFTISYDDVTNAVIVDGYNTQVAESCLLTTCLLDGSVSYGVSLVISEFITFTNGLLTNSSIALDSETTAAIASLQQTAALASIFGVETLELASVSVEYFDAITDPIGADPTGTGLDATVTDGLIEIGINGQEDPIFSESLGSEVLANAASAVKITTADAGSEAAKSPVETIESTVKTTEPVKPPIATYLTPAGTNKSVIVASTSAGGAISVTTSDLAISQSGSVTIEPKGLTTLENWSEDGGTDPKDVPEPSILLGLLGSAALIKRSRKETVG